MKSLLLTAAAALCATATLSTAEGLPPAAPTLKMLEGGSDWTPIFDGKSLAGWKGEGYAVEGGAIVCTPKGSFLQTEKEYSDFVLDFEFQLAPGANNGIGLRYPGSGDAAYVGMEIQVLDDRHEKYKGLQEWQFHGSVYGVQPSGQAKVNRLKPVGEWNQAEIKINKGKLDLFLNGTNVVSTTLWDDNWKKLVAGSKFKAMPDFATFKSGHIALQDHGDMVWYKNIRIRKL